MGPFAPPPPHPKARSPPLRGMTAVSEGTGKPLPPSPGLCLPALSRGAPRLPRGVPRLFSRLLGSPVPPPAAWLVGRGG